MAAAETGGHSHPPSAHGEAAEEVKQHKPVRGPPAVYFPLGYKEAAYQWVCTSFKRLAQMTIATNTNNLTAVVDKYNPSNG